MKQETFPFWHFLVRGAAAIGWTAMSFMIYPALVSVLSIPPIIIGTVLTIKCVIGHYKLIQLFDYILLDMEDGEDE